MPFSLSLDTIQKKLAEYTPACDGWLIYDNVGTNTLARPLLGLAPNAFLSRRFYYWIPKGQEPIKIVHFIDLETVLHLPGTPYIYSSSAELDAILSTHLKGKKTIAMEYSPQNEIPALSKLDAGTYEWLREHKITPISSWFLLEPFVAKLNRSQIQLHKEASDVILKAVSETFDLARSSLSRNEVVTELDLQAYLLAKLKEQGCITSHPPIVAVGEHSSSPHYAPTEKTAFRLQENALLLIDCWCKKEKDDAPYADHTFVAFMGKAKLPPEQLVRIYSIVFEAQQKAIEFLKERLSSKKAVFGYEVDDVARKYIADKGYGHNFLHRTGHSIDQEVHANGPNFDNYETHDTRQITPNTCYSIEPGIYIPELFGVRLECNVLILDDNSILVTGQSPQLGPPTLPCFF